MSENKKNTRGLILVFIMAVVGLAFTPSISEAITLVTWTNNGTAGFPPTGTGNLTGAARVVASLFPLFWVIGLIAIPVYYIRMWLKSD